MHDCRSQSAPPGNRCIETSPSADRDRLCCATGLLLTDPASAAIRPTYDVDVIAEIASYAEYTLFSTRLQDLGFHVDSSEGAPLCRWLHTGLTLDVMPLDQGILGFTNRWYPGALHSSVEVQLPNGLFVRLITAPYFLGTKLEAFRGRGRHDYFASHDLEDCIAVVDGRQSLLDEVRGAPEDLQVYLAEAIQSLLTDSRFLDALPGYLLPDTANQSRLPSLLSKLEQLGGL